MWKQSALSKLVAIFLVTLISTSIVCSGFSISESAAEEWVSSKEGNRTLMENGGLDTTTQTDRDSVSAISFASSVQTLPMSVMEDVLLLEDGTTELTLVIDVPSSPLCDAYRKSFGVTPDTDVDERLPMPESIGISENVESKDGGLIVIPIGEEFYRSIEHQQQISMGLDTIITSSYIVPRTINGGFMISIDAAGSLPIALASQTDEYSDWGVKIKPVSPGALLGSTFTTIEMIQMMLASIPEQQSYECLWSSKIRLPTDARLTNANEISGLKWKISFGGGTYLESEVSVRDSTTIIITERTVITENPITASFRYLSEVCSHYKSFIIKYRTHTSTGVSLINTQAKDDEFEADSEDNWYYQWEIGWSDEESVPFGEAPFTGSLTATASITLTGYVGWNIDLFQGITHFESWMNLAASVEVDFEAEFSASYSKTWDHQFFQWKTTYYFVVGVVPVWADFQIGATGVLTVNAYGKILLTAQAIASASFKAGVEWSNQQGWSPIFQVDTDASYSGPTISAEAGVCIRPSIPFRLALLFYGVAGPFVEFEPYALATLTCTYPPPHGEWEISANLQITAGATFVGWLKDLLGLDDWSVLLYSAQLAVWSGSWGPSTMSITETLNPPITLTSSLVQVYGTAIFGDGGAVSFADVTLTIVQTGASWMTITDFDGYYSAYIAAPGSAGSYTVKVSISTGALSSWTSQVLTVADVGDPGANYNLYRTTTCKDVQPSSPYDAIDETEVFRTDDSIEWTWVHLTYVYRSLNVRWEWYRPDGSYYADSVVAIPSPSSSGYDYWEWYKCWGGIYISGYAPEDIEGRWHCKVYIDEGEGYELVAAEEFVIRYEIASVYRTMAKDVLGGVGSPVSPYDPVDPTNRFLNTDPRALGWIRLDELAEAIEVKWEWRDPSGSIDSTWNYVSSDPAAEGYLYYTWYKFWGWIGIAGTSRQSKVGTWELRAYIEDVYGNWDLEYSEYFAISDNTPPGAPGIPVDAGDVSTTGDVTWTWTQAPEDWVVAKYQIQVGTSPGGNDIFDGYAGTDLTKALSDLPSGFTYYARVRAMNTVGQWGPWSSSSDGIVVDRPPVTIIVEGPSETIDYYDVSFTWEGTDDVTPSTNLIYSYYLRGKDASWSTWQSATGVEYNDLQDGSYEFLVKARDLRGSEDQTPANRSFTISTYSVHLESESVSGTSPNLGTIEFGDTNYTLPTDIRTRRTVAESEVDIFSLPAGARRTDPGDLTLEGTKMLQSLSLNGGGQTITVNLGETVSVDCTYQLWSPVNPTELDQLFFIYSWTPSWPPTSDYYYGIYHGMPGLPPGVSGSASFTFTAPSTPGTYYLYWCYGCHYSIPLAVSTYTQALSSPGHAKIIVEDASPQYTARYNASADYLFDHWEATGGIFVSDVTDNPTTVTVRDDGTLKAVYTSSHDIAVTAIATSKTVVGRGHSLSINVTVENQGMHTETFNVTACANTIAIEEEVTLASGSFTTITLIWNTTGCAYGTYAISAYVTPVTSETDTSDNTFISGTAIVTISGDVDGDGDVDGSDLSELSMSYGSFPSPPIGNPNCDINGNNLTDVSDLFFVGKNHGLWAQPEPVGYWKFDEGSENIAYDSSGNNHQGTIYGATWADGYVGKALNFDGAGDYVAVPDDPSLSGFTELTLEAWIKADSLGAGQRGIINKGNGLGYTGDEYGLQLNYDKVTLVLSAGSPNGWILIVHSPPAITIGQWYHIAATWNSTHYCIYVNGTTIASGPVGLPGATTHDTANSLNIGAISSGGWSFDGIIDEVKIYDYSRTAEEIGNDYDSTVMSLSGVNHESNFVLNTGTSGSSLVVLKRQRIRGM